jgi:hypothetical protein
MFGTQVSADEIALLAGPWSALNFYAAGTKVVTQLELPNWTTATRPAGPNVGRVGFNTTLGSQEEWTGTAWLTAPTSASVTASITAAVATETVRAETAEALLAPLASPAFSGTAAAATLNVAAGNVFNDVGRNRTDNGNFEIAQRTLPVIVSGAYTLDRWIASWSAGTASISQGTATTYTCRKQITGVFTGLTVGATAAFVHRIESARSYDLAGTTATLSFNTAYTVSAGTTTFTAQLFYANATDNFTGVTAIGSPTAFVPSGTPGTYSAPVSIPSGATTGLQIVITATQASATGNLTWSITSVQLEAGAVATQFERIDPPLSSARCRDYFQSYSTTSVFAAGYATAGNPFWSSLTIPTMRAIPTVSGVTAGTATNANTPVVTASSPYSIILQGNAVATGPGFLYMGFGLSADL